MASLDTTRSALSVAQLGNPRDTQYQQRFMTPPTANTQVISALTYQPKDPYQFAPATEVPVSEITDLPSITRVTIHIHNFSIKRHLPKVLYFMANYSIDVCCIENTHLNYRDNHVISHAMPRIFGPGQLFLGELSSDPYDEHEQSHLGIPENSAFDRVVIVPQCQAPQQ